MSFLARIVAALTVASTLVGAASRAEPLLTGGIGLQSCAKLAPELKPELGLDHPPNYLLCYWVQGYISAANIFLLNQYTDYVDIAKLEPSTIVTLVADFCSDNPYKQPISAIDKFIRDTPKVEARESTRLIRGSTDDSLSAYAAAQARGAANRSRLRRAQEAASRGR